MNSVFMDNICHHIVITSCLIFYCMGIYTLKRPYHLTEVIHVMYQHVPHCAAAKLRVKYPRTVLP